MIGLPGLTKEHTLVYNPTPEPILEFFDFIDKIKFGLIIIQNFVIKYKGRFFKYFFLNIFLNVFK